MISVSMSVKNQKRIRHVKRIMAGILVYAHMSFTKIVRFENV